jgi:uncharacterized protein
MSVRTREPRITRTTQEADRILAPVKAARDVPGGVRYDLEIADGEERIPAALLVPASEAPSPAALLLHGFGSRKERMTDTLGESLLLRGVAALSIDLPLHGDRAGSPSELRSGNPMALLGAWRDAVRESRLAMGFLAGHPHVDADRLAIVGYSLGSFLGVTVAARDRSVRAVVLAAGGDLPDDMPFGAMVRAVVDPVGAVQRLDGTPLLMVHGKRDRTVTPGQARRLFDAAREPKEIRWWDAGHRLPAAAIGEAAAWLSNQLGALGRRRTG